MPASPPSFQHSGTQQIRPDGCCSIGRRLSKNEEKMTAKLILSSLSVAALLAAAQPIDAQVDAMAQDATQPTNNCAPTDKIDGSTANDARKKMEAAGYTDVTALYKGCDNVWHGQARANGAAVNVMVGPDGVVRQEGS
jgi:hypothetical protein